MLEGELPAPAAMVREGVDFSDPQGAARAAGGMRQGRRVPAWALVVMRVVRELRIHEATGQLPGGLCVAAQPAWKAELWEAYWQVKA